MRANSPYKEMSVFESRNLPLWIRVIYMPLEYFEDLGKSYNSIGTNSLERLNTKGKKA